MENLDFTSVLDKLTESDINIRLNGDEVIFEGNLSILSDDIKHFLRQNKQQIVSILKSVDDESESQILPVEEGPYPLSYAQNRLWIQQEMEPDSAFYNVPLLVRLDGPLNLSALESAMTALLERHEILRTVYVQSADGNLSQVVNPVQHLSLPVTNLSSLSEAQQDQYIQTYTDAVTGKVFDLSADLMLRAELLQLSEQYHLLLICIHHIVTDGWSLGILTGELGQFYNTSCQGLPSQLLPLAIQYKDFAHWQRSWMGSDRQKKQLQYWVEQLDDIPSVHGLVLDNPRPEVPSLSGAVHRVQISLSVKRRIEQLARAHGGTLFMVLHAAFVALLHRYSGDKDIVLGTPVANREHAALTPLVGFFVNSLALRSCLEHNMSFKDLLMQSKNVLLAAYKNQSVPFEQVVEALQPERILAHSPIFQILISLQNNTQEALTLSGLTISGMDTEKIHAKYELSLDMREHAEGLELNWEYATDLFDAHTIEGMASCFHRILESVSANPTITVGNLPLLSEAEKSALLSAWKSQHVVPINNTPAHQLFEAQAAKTPDSIALEQGSNTLTYGELNDRSNCLANRLIASGVTSDTAVGLCVERSADLVIGMLAIMKSGGYYVPLDSTYPVARLEYMASDAKLNCLVVDEKNVSNIPQYDGLRIHINASISEEIKPLPVPDVRAEHRGYVIFTSGSTGLPKGVGVTHGALGALLSGCKAQFAIASSDSMASISAYGFDISLFEILLPLISGGRVLLLNREQSLDMGALVEALKTCTLLHTVPGLMAEIVAYKQNKQHNCLSSIRQIFVGGDRVSPSLINSLVETFKGAHINELYGPTEGTILTTTHRVDPHEKAVTSVIGNPLPHAEIYILDNYQQFVPEGVIGELYIGGAGVAEGYVNNPELTTERFVANPFKTEGESRLYRSGDLVVWRNARIEYVGRCDSQVKVRGYRIEPGEIEQQIIKDELINDVLVKVLKSSSGEKVLVAYVISLAEKEAVISRLNNALSKTLPAYMIPSIVHVMNVWPVTPNGKIDAKALPGIISQQDLSEYQPPIGEIETQLQGIWSELLGVAAQEISRDANFFSLGGHSLLLVRLKSRISQTFDISLETRGLFVAATLKEMANFIANGQSSKDVIIPKKAREEQPAPLSQAQYRLWLTDRVTGNSSQYNLCIAFKLQGSLHREALEKALYELATRHAVLRTTFHTDETGEPYQLINASIDVPVPYVDLRNQHGEKVEEEIKRVLNHEKFYQFDLERDSMLRASLVAIEDEVHLLCINVHHIASDGWSTSLLLEDFNQFYQLSCEDKYEAVEACYDYADIAIWQTSEEYQQQLEEDKLYWQNKLQDTPVLHSLPLDNARPAAQSFVGGNVATRFNASTTQSLLKIAGQQQTTLYTVVHALLAALVYRYSGQKDVVIGSVLNGRENSAMETVVGFFVNTLPLRVNANSESSYLELLASCKEVMLELIEHQQLTYDALLELLQVERSLAYNPLFQIVLTFDDFNKEQHFQLGDLSTSILEPESIAALYDLSVNASLDDGCLQINWNYNSDIFEPAGIQQFARHFEQFCHQVIADPEASLGQYELLDESEQQALRAIWRSQTATDKRCGCLHTFFEERVVQKPDAIAVSDVERAMSYGELNSRANQIAHMLRSMGVKQGCTVGLCVERNCDMLAAMLGIMKSGGVFVPLDPNYPEKRCRFIVEDAAIRYLLTQNNLIASSIRDELIVLDVESADLGLQPTYNLALDEVELSPEKDIYLLYTSGSTGTPKGVRISHQNLVAMVDWAEQHFTPQELQRSLACTTLNFDPAMFEIFPALCLGYEVVVIRDVLALTHVDVAPTTMFSVPSAMALLVEQNAVPDSLISVMVGGEKVPETLVNDLLTKCQVPIVHHAYGPTEDTIYSTCQKVTEPLTGKLGIGLPTFDTRLYILNESGKLVPPGVMGELHVGGAGVAIGYLNRPELTAEKFIENPVAWAPDKRLYRTGDLVKQTRSGNIEYLGRANNQIKLFGMRVELGEIERHIANIAAVEQVIVSVGNGETPRIVACIASKSCTSDVDLANDIKSELFTYLPRYMIPASFIVCPEFPKMENGKVNMQALLDYPVVISDALQSPATETEKVLAGFWQELLGCEQISTMARFFDIGGNSLLATRFQAKIEKHWKIELMVRDILALQTIQAISAKVDELLLLESIVEETKDVDEEEWIV